MEKIPATSSGLYPIPGKIVVVIGGSHKHNEILVRNLLQAKATVIWPNTSQTPQELDSFVQNHHYDGNRGPYLFIPPIDPTQNGGLAQLLSYCTTNFHRIDGIVAYFRPCIKESGPCGALHQDYESIGKELLVENLVLARAFAYFLARWGDASYIFVNDSPICCSSQYKAVYTAVLAAEHVLADALATEMNGQIAVHSVVLTESPRNGSSFGLDIHSLAEAVALILMHPEYAKDQVVIPGQWREALDPRASGPEYCSYL